MSVTSRRYRSTGFARQQWRAWIETKAGRAAARHPGASPVSNGGRGLKLPGAQQAIYALMASPVSNGGRGLKPVHRPASTHCGRFARQQWRAWIETPPGGAPCPSPPGFARQQWRAWIETCAQQDQQRGDAASPVSNGGRGLKLERLHLGGVGQRFARQQWRAWIETSRPLVMSDSPAASPVSNGGRGLKPGPVHILRVVKGFARQQWRAWIETRRAAQKRKMSAASPVSNGGRGLKRPTCGQNS